MRKGLVYAMRYSMFAIATLIGALGIALVTNANLGTTPISSLPYALSFICGVSFGTSTFGVNILFIILQRIVLGRNFRWTILLQLPAVLMFSAFIDFWMWVTGSLCPDVYWGKWLMSISGNAVLGFSIAMAVVCKATVQPGEGIVLAIAVRSRKNFGNIKILFDVSLVIMAVVLSYFTLGEIVGFREGTVVSAVAVGMFVKFFSRWTNRFVPEWNMRKRSRVMAKKGLRRH